MEGLALCFKRTIARSINLRASDTKKITVNTAEQITASAERLIRFFPFGMAFLFPIWSLFMKARFVIAALVAMSPPAFAVVIQPAAAQQAALPMSARATLAEKHVRTLLKAAAPGGKMDYSILSDEVGKAVRDHPEGGEMIVKLGTVQSITYLGDPPGSHLFRISFATGKVDFFLALNAAGKISSMYYHPAMDMPA